MRKELDALKRPFNQPTTPNQTDPYFVGWNEGLEKAAVEIEKMQGFGQDTLSSFAIYIRGLKK